MKPITKAEEKRIEREVNTYINQLIINYLIKAFNRSSLRPIGGFRIGYGWGLKTHGDFDSIFVACRCYDGFQEGRLMINYTDSNIPKTKSQINKIKKLISGEIIEEIQFKYETIVNDNSCQWFSWEFTIQ